MELRREPLWQRAESGVRTDGICTGLGLFAAALTVGDVVSDTVVGVWLDTWAFGPDPPLPPPATAS